ncbi:GLUG motif-containing protein [Aliarcobacter butzleri]|uniref:GLUG motif-containing protein n=7 Tax=Aliarcobacter butzleri TaxID=28197 RepID=UPI00344EC5E5
MYLNQEYKNRFRILKGGLISLVVASNLYGAPTGGIVTSGNANISQNGNTTNINQSSQKATINWQSFGIKNGETVNFNQPNSNSITLNRVIGNEKSIIDGALNANGQVWILNSNGTLFGKNAKVNTSGLLVTTKNISDDDFQKGNYSFRGDSKASIENLGNISSEKYSSFIANSVVNNGTIKVHSGTINLTGASEFSISLDENSNISLKVTKGVLDALVENNNLLIANGGNVYLTTNAKNELLKGVVNNSGIIEANSLDDITGKQSEVIIFAHGGTANIDGEIKAKNSFVETSGENLNVSANTKVIAKTWLLDPVNMTIESTGGNSLTGASVSAIAIQNALGGTNVELQADNNITVNQNITWSTDKQLKLSADNINVNATINNTNKTNGGVYFNAANNQSKVVFGADGKVIVNNVYQLQWINTALGGKYELGSNIDAGVTSSWNSGAGFNPIGETLIDNPFNGILDGKNYAISNLHIHRPDSQFVGLFKYIKNSTIKNIGLENTSITGLSLVGGLTGLNQGGLIENSYITGTINGSYSFIGGLVGFNQNGTINNSYAIGTVNGTASGNTAIGGLIGWNDTGAINNSYATGYVNGSSQVGGLVGNNTGTINNSYASNFVNGSSQVGGLTGNSYVQSNNSFYNIDINAGSMYDAQLGRTQEQIRNLITGEEWATNQELGRGYGLGLNTYLPFLKNVTKLSNTLFEDGHGTSANPYTITNWTQLQNINNSNILTQNYYFNLLNNLSNQTSDYTNLASSTANSNKGWNPIGTWIISFIGNFNGMGNTISNLYINRATSQNYIGLFGHTDSDTIIKNIGLINVDIKGKHYTGGLVGYSYGSTIENSYSSGNITGTDAVGGLVGYNNGGTIQNSYASNLITGNNYVGGLVGQNYGTIVNSYSGGNVTGNNTVGGLIGLNQGGLIENSYSTSSVMVNGGVGDAYIGGLVGRNYQGTVKNSYASGLVSVNISQINGTLYAGGLIGLNDNGTIQDSFYDKETNTSSFMGDISLGKTKAEILSAFSGKNGWGSGRGASVEGYELALLPYLVGITREEDFSKTTLFNSGYGTSANPYTITNWTQLQNINNSNILTQNYYFNLLNNLNSSTAGYMGNTGAGWNPIGNYLNNFNGTFDGKGFTISDLYINRLSQSYVGLFGWISGTIKNLGLVDENITGNSAVGGLVGQNYGTIQNSYATGWVFGTGNYVGGLVGQNNGTIQNSYASGTVSGNLSLGGLVGDNGATITNSFYDNTKFTGNGVGSGTTTGVTGLTTEQMQHGTVYKTAGWDIVADSSLATGTPVRKWDSVNNKYVWAIAPKVITGNLSNQAVTYNGLLQNLSSIYTSQAIFGTTGMSFKFVDNSGDITAFKNAGTYSNIGVVLTGTDEFTVAGVGTKGTLTINKADLDIVANSDSKVYNGQTQSVSGYTFGANGLLGSDTASAFALTGVNTTSSSKNVGTYNTNITQNGVADNYNLNITQGELEITKANITITGLTADNKVYNGNTTASVNIGSVGYTGKFGSDDIEINTAGLSGEFANKNVGNHQVNISGVALSGTDANNYNVTAPSSLTANITQKELTVNNSSIVGTNKIYDGTKEAQLTTKGTLSGVIGSETLNLNYVASFSDKNAENNKNIDVTYSLADGSNGGLASNYKFVIGQETTTTTANIFKKDVSNIQYTAENKTYDGNNKALVKGNSSDFIAGDKIGFSQSANFDDKNAGFFKNIFIENISLSGADKDNYNLTNNANQTKIADISKKDLKVIVADESKIYDGTTFEGGKVSYSGFVAGEDESVFTNGSLQFTGKALGATEIGKYNLTASTSDFDAQNYNIIYVDGVLNIKTKPVETSQNNEIQKVIDNIPNVAKGFSPTINGNLNENTLVPSSSLNTNQNVQTLALGKNLGISIVNGGVNAPSINIEEIKNLLSTQN